MKVPIQNKIQPGISKRETQVHEPRNDRNDSRLVPHQKTECQYHLDREKGLLINHGTRVGMDAYSPI